MRKLLLLDANVLIDYANSELRVLSLASRHLGHVATASAVLDEVGRVNEDQCATLGIELLEPTLEQIQAASVHSGRLSFQDRLCLILARDGGYVCVTNDRRLRAECVDSSILILWGLELMVELVHHRHLQVSTALRVAHAIHLSNPAHITPEILHRFEQKIST